MRYLEKVKQSKVDEATKKVLNFDLHAAPIYTVVTYTKKKLWPV